MPIGRKEASLKALCDLFLMQKYFLHTTCIRYS